jgi:acylphosphatase
MTVRRRVLVSGRVQGVWYRDSARHQAERLGVKGVARNLRDGRVELDIEGEPDAVEAMIAWASVGPPRARVDGVTVEVAVPQGLTAFRVS